jgi:hypothetical protein
VKEAHVTSFLMGETGLGLGPGKQVGFEDIMKADPSAWTARSREGSLSKVKHLEVSVRLSEMGQP